MVLPNPFATRILLIDDDQEDVQLFAEAIKDAVPWTDFHGSLEPTSVLENLDKHNPDVLFLDINMHQVNGFNCLEKIRSTEKYEKLPVVMYSSSSYRNHIDFSYELGATLYFEKPTMYSELVSSLKEILAMKWHKPSSIRAMYLKNGKFFPFKSTLQ